MLAALSMYSLLAGVVVAAVVPLVVPQVAEAEDRYIERPSKY